MKKVEVRFSEEKDLPRIAALEQLCFSDPIPADFLERMLNNDTQLMLTAQCDETAAGYLSMQFVLDEGYINNIAVYPEYRRMGIGDLMLEKLETWAGEKGLAIMTLEVRESNLPAIALYAKHGFETTGIRKNYYEKPKENAILMTKYF